ncbi:MAG: MMPL family transporter [Deltaproteobacteria bacterium]|nr:MMPL family transporter [Deltaproteobacteria bacterium]
MRINKNAIWSRLTEKYVGLCFKRPFAALGVFGILASFSAWYAIGNIRVVTDLAALLPSGTSSVDALNESKERIGSTDLFTIAIESKSGDSRAIAKMQDIINDRIEKKWDDASWTQIDRDTSFFREHALYYLPTDRLADLKNRLEEELVRASAEVIPGMVNLLDDNTDKDNEKEPQEKGIENWYDDDLPREIGFPPQVADEFSSFFSDEDNQPSTLSENNLSSRLIGPEGKVGVVLVQLDKPSTNLEYAGFALKRGEALIRNVNPKSIAPDLNAQVVGAYRSFKEVDAVADDGKIATVISVSLILLLMLLFFRSPRTVIAVFVPLAAAATFTMGMTALIYGRLTALTIFVLAMLVGMGIDYGIHLFSRILFEFRSGTKTEAATTESIKSTGGALAVAALTTIASLLTLLFGHFEGFKEFGVVASYGLLFSVVCSVLILPPTVAAMERIAPYKRQQSVTKRRRFLGNLNKSPIIRNGFIVGASVTALLLCFVPRARFEHDFRNLRSKHTGTTIHYGRAVGKNAGTAPAVLLGRNHVQMKAAHNYLLDRVRKKDALEIGSFITIHTFVPSQAEQLQRREIIKKIGEIANKRAMRRLKDKKRRLVDELKTMAAAEPFDKRDIPSWAKRIVTERDGRVGLIGHMYTKIEDWNANAVGAFKRRFGNLEFEGETLPIACSGFILADVVEMVQADGARLLFFVSIALVVILLVSTRDPKAAAILFSVIAAGAVWIVGAMGLLDVRIGLYNLIVIPVVLGVGIDSAIHLYHRHQQLGASGIDENLRTTGFSVTASSLTTMAGFVGLLFVGHKGLQTIGVLACLGVGLSWLSVMLLLPFLMTRFLKANSPSSVRDVRPDLDTTNPQISPDNWLATTENASQNTYS